MTTSTTGPTAELRTKREAKLAIHLDGETNMDADAVLSTMIDPPTYELASIDLVLTGQDQVRQLLELMFSFLPGIVHRAVTERRHLGARKFHRHFDRQW